MHKVAVTGATGWIGRYVVALLLRKGYEVHATYRKAPLAAGGHWHQVDLLSADNAARFIEEVRPDSLVHLAWEAVPPACYRSLVNYEWTRNSMALIQQFVLCGGKRIVVSGTGAEYAWDEGVLLTESASPDSYAHAYAASKNSLRIWLESYAGVAGFSAAWGRLFHMYGPYDPGNRLVASMITSLLNKQEAYCKYGSLHRDYLYIEDAADALVALLESCCEGTVNIASGHPVQLQQLVRQIGSMMGQEENIRFGVERPNEPVFVGVDISRLANEVKWKSSYSLAEGLERTIRWYADQAK
ncbi:NAD(P)-dependent oxidoreductase [Paenibacillus glycanilyticus]|uniref:NAD-dependent epimerase/dehydratase family protein n=1 Tax=Paenibacillus glycanilyticus TaxID=126569 RepID=UPI00203A450A|nr:NAD(P)-dependent oxidoreductase [Paenibacillus glycanilyticus]MCM3627081.1 NAD(P)-dependent oxidoreductase [Paenibacillus glycanilyticus]